MLTSDTTSSLSAQFALRGVVSASLVLCIAVAAACSDPTAVPVVLDSRTPTAMATPVPEALSTPTPAATATPVPTIAPASTPAAAPTPADGATPLPTTVPAPTPTPEPAPGPSPTARPATTPAAEEPDIRALYAILPWLESPPDAIHAGAARDITAIWDLDAGLGETVASLPWVRDVDAEEASTLAAMALIAEADLETADSLSRSPWLAQRAPEAHFLSRFHRHIVTPDPDLARSIAGSASAGRVPRDLLGEVIQYLTDMATNDQELVRLVVNFPWFTDGVTDEELSRLEDFAQMSQRDPGLSTLVAAVPWIADGIGTEERSLLQDLADLGRYDTQLGVNVAAWLRSPSDDLGLDVVKRLVELANGRPAQLGAIARQPWFTDGLDDQESAFVVVLSYAATLSVPFFEELLRSHDVRRERISLALAGNVDMWVFQNSPLSDADVIFAAMEDTARISEELYGVPFPKRNIILMVVDPENTEHTIGQGHLGSHMVLERFLGEVENVAHETAHYYARYGAEWFAEGGAEFVAAYVDHWNGVQGLDAHTADTVRRLRDNCASEGIANIAHLNYQRSHIYTQKGGCTYIMGEHLLLNIHDTIGGPAMSRAFEELYLLGVGSGTVSEEAVYTAFRDQSPTSARAAFDDLYRRLHGGDYADPQGAFQDDHGDDPGSASRITVGGPVGGSLDYRFDFDFFRFDAEQGGGYRITVEHPSLHPSHMMLFAPDGTSPEIWNWTSRRQTSVGTEILWTAPVSGEHFFAVQDFAGNSGTYTLAVTRFVERQDDHGDTADTATLISLDAAVEGRIDNALDQDYFRFQGEGGRRYRVDVENDTMEFSRVDLLVGDASSLTYQGGGYGRESSYVRWVMHGSGMVYLSVDSPQGGEGTYRLTVTIDPDETAD